MNDSSLFETINSDDDYFVTAVQMFETCGVDASESIHVDELINKCSPSVLNNKFEYRCIKNALDPENINPTISVTKLATALIKSRVDLDDSYSSRSQSLPHDSDSGISTDGFQLSELQCELRDKTHLVSKLRSQLDFSDKHHLEMLASITAERDSLHSHLHILREENASLLLRKCEYEEMTERVEASEASLEESKRQQHDLRKKLNKLQEEIDKLYSEKQTLQGLLTQSKDECHRINDMYASRQAVLLEQNERLKTEYADLSTRLQDQDEFMQQIIKEKAVLEIELKDLMNKSVHAMSYHNRTIDVSYSDDNVLSTLDSLSADSRFAPVQTSVSTQVNEPCTKCQSLEKKSKLKGFLWDSTKWMFQLCAVFCFGFALLQLYNITQHHYTGQRCVRPAAAKPWSWLSVKDLLDLVFRIEYIGEVPM